MSVRSFRNLILGLIAVSFAIVAHSQSPSHTTIPLTSTNALDGKEMFTSYCAPCHGLDARGSGPVASALKQTPPDLTELSKNHNGKFPATHVSAILHLGAPAPAHGAGDMPIWGPLLGTMDHPNSLPDSTLRINKLVRYLEQIQTK